MRAFPKDGGRTQAGGWRCLLCRWAHTPAGLQSFPAAAQWGGGRTPGRLWALGRGAPQTGQTLGCETFGCEQ